MRSLSRIFVVLALGLAPQLGCTEAEGSGGSTGGGGTGGIAGEGGGGFATGGSGGTMEAFDPLRGIEAVELIADGFMFTEGPTWRSAQQRLLFTDIPANTIHQLTPPDDVSVFRPAGGHRLRLTHSARVVSCS